MEDAADTPEEGTAQEPLLSIGTTVNVTPSPNATVGNEVSAAVVPVTGGSVVFATFNSDHNLPQADGKVTHCGWAKSNTSFTSFQSFDSFFTPLPVPTTSTGSAFLRCQGDTYASAIGWTNQVLMTAVDQLQDGKNEVVLYGSTNGGTSFSRAVTLSSGTSTGATDGQKMAADPNNHALYVWWWNANAQSGVNNHFLRKVTVSSTGAFTLGPIKTLTGLTGGSPAPLQASIAVKPGPSGGRPRIFLAYPSAGMSEDDCTSPNGKIKSVTWTLSVSDDEGTTWQAFTIDSDASWPTCMFQSPSTPGKDGLGDNRSYVSLAYDPTSDRAILAYQKHVEDVNLSYLGTRVITAVWPNDPGGTGFDYWTPICNPAVCPPPGNCLVQGRLPVGETYCTQFGQSIASRAVGASSRLTVVWHDTRDTNPATFPHPPVGDATTRNKLQSDVWGHSIRPGEPIDCPPSNPCPKTQSRITALGSGVPWLPNGTNGNTWWGDYEAGTVSLGSKFFTVWADNRDGSINTRLKGASFLDGEMP